MDIYHAGLILVALAGWFNYIWLRIRIRRAYNRAFSCMRRIQEQAE